MKHFILLSLILCPLRILAQQDPLYSQYFNNYMTLNPAYAGMNHNLNASVQYRAQWTGFDGSPTTLNFNTHTSILRNQAGAGLLLVKDQLGNVTNTEMQAAFAYELKFNKTQLRFGMQIGFINYRTNTSNLNLADPNDPAFATNENVTKPNIGAGVILQSEKYMIGLSVPRLMSTTVSNGGQSYEAYSQHYYLMGAYIFRVNENVKFKPLTVLKGVAGAPLSVDLNANFIFKDTYTAGVFTRNFGTYGFLLQAKLLDHIKLGYTYEMPTNQSVGTRFVTHELFLGVVLKAFSYHDPYAVTNF